MAAGTATAPLSLTVRLVVGQPAPVAREDLSAGGSLHAILPETTAQAPPGAGAVLHPAALSAVAGSARRLLALAGASPGADVGVLSRAMEELDRLAAAGTPADRVVDLSTSASTSTAADMDIDSAGGGDAVPSNQLGGGAGAARGRRKIPGTKRKRDCRRTGRADGDASGMSQRPAKRRILAWRVRRLYRSLVAKATATARRARSRRARAQPMRRRRKAVSWKSVEQQLARATLSDGLHRWSPGGSGGGPAGQ